MSYLGPTALKQINRAIQTGRGAAASVLGQGYDVYRLSNQTGSLVQGNPLYVQFQCSLRRSNDRNAIENSAFELLVFEGLCNNMPLQLGDVLVENPAYYEGTGSAYVVAQMRPRRETLLVRAEANISITYPNPGGGQAGQQPASGIVAQNPYTNYGGLTKANELMLVLNNGLYSWSTSGSLAAVPAGLQPQNRVRSLHKPDFPTQVPETRFVVFLPLLNGVQILENCILNFPNGDRYLVLQPYTSSNVGLSGWILLTEKMAV